MAKKCTECGAVKSNVKGHIKMSSGDGHGEHMELPDDWESKISEVDGEDSEESEDESNDSSTEDSEESESETNDSGNGFFHNVKQFLKTGEITNGE